MNDVFGPPDDSEQNVRSSDGRRRRWIVTGAALGGLALGGVGVAQLATASGGDSVSVRTATGASATVENDVPSDDATTSPDDAPTPSGDAETPPGDGPFAGWPELDEAFGPYDDCLQARVGDLLPDWEELGDELGGWVESIDVDLPWGDGSVLVEDGEGLPTWFDFGEGDGSVTVTRADGTISVETSGDVTEVDGSAVLDHVIDGDVFDALPALPEIDDETLAELDAAHEACADLLPEGADIQIGDIDLGDLDLGNLDLGELPIDLSEIDLGDLDLGDLPIDLSEIDLGNLDLDAMFDELSSRTD